MLKIIKSTLNSC